MDDARKKILMFNHEFPPIGGWRGLGQLFFRQTLRGSRARCASDYFAVSGLSESREGRRFSCASRAGLAEKPGYMCCTRDVDLRCKLKSLRLTVR